MGRYRRFADVRKRRSAPTDIAKSIPKKQYIGAMHVIAAKAAPEVVAAVNPAGANRLLDVGGGSGAYTLAFLDAKKRSSEDRGRGISGRPAINHASAQHAIRSGSRVKREEQTPQQAH